MRQKDKQKSSFHLLTTSFFIDITMENDQLTIVLKDYIDQTLYITVYNGDDIEGERNQNVDMKDLFNSVMNFNKYTDQSTIKQMKQHPYQTGHVIQYGSIPLFKIERGGKLTIYVIMKQANQNNQIRYECELLLKKYRQFSGTEILIQKLEGQKNKFREIYDRQMHQLAKQNLRLSQNLRDMEQQCKIMKKKLRTLQMSMKQSEQGQKRQKIITEGQVYSFVQYNKYFSNHFKVYNNCIQYLLEDSQYTSYIIDKIIPYNSNFTFEVKITKARQNAILIGIVDSQKQKYFRSSYNSGNSVAYQGSNGFLCPEKICKGKGFKTGETVEVNIDLENKSICWSVNGLQRMKSRQQSLGDKTRTFMPYIQMKDTNDIVEIYL